MALPVIRSIVVPSELYHAAQRANFSLMDLTVFCKLRQITSLEDIAVFAVLNQWLCVGHTQVATSPLQAIMNHDGANSAEWNSVFGYMTQSEEIFKLAQASIEPVGGSFAELLELKLSEGVARPVPNKSLANTMGTITAPDEYSTYQLKTSGSNVFVVVGPGFSKYVGAHCKNEHSSDFIRAFLLHCGGLYGPTEVARHPLFKTFLHSLAV